MIAIISFSFFCVCVCWGPGGGGGGVGVAYAALAILLNYFFRVPWQPLEHYDFTSCAVMADSQC